MEKTTNISLDINTDNLDRILKIADYTGLTVDEVVSEAIEMYLQEEQSFIDDVDEALDLDI